MWRGLQVVLWLALGVAPSLAQMQVQSIDIESFHPAIDGNYTSNVYQSDLGNGTYFQVFSDGDREVVVYDNGTIVISVDASNYLAGGTVTFLPDGTASYDPAVFTNVGEWSVAVDGVLWSVKASNPDPYQDAFPDWATAATIIPLGFSFSMAFWAACVAVSVSMRWVRDLASAAT